MASPNAQVPKATPFILAELVVYAPGSVVSRTLIQHRTGTLTVFAFDQDQGLSEHTAPFDAMVSILDGVADITIGGKTQSVRAGQTIIMPAHVAHALHAPEPFKMLLTMIREDVSVM